MRYSTNYLRALRRHFGLSQSELAHYLGVDRTLLAHAEAGRRTLPGAAALQSLPLLCLLPPPHGSAPADPLPPDPAETTPKTLDALQWRLRVCRHEAAMLVYRLELQLPRLQAARQRRTLPTRLAALPPPAPLPVGLPAPARLPNPRWAESMAESATADLARFGVQTRALLEARRAGLLAEAVYLEGVLGMVPVAAAPGA